jgi:hypothetical protein
VSGTFAIFLGSAYWEEFWDGDNAGSLAPKDLAKVTLWMLALYVVRALSILVWRRYGALRRAAAESTTDPHVPSAWLPPRGVHEACQYEPTRDRVDDEPFIDRVFNRADKWHPAPACEALLRTILAD